MSVGMEDHTQVHEHAIDPFLARAALDRLADRAREALLWSAIAAAAGVTLIVVGQPRFGFPPLLGAIVGILVGLLARSDRQALVGRLVRQRSAYAIEEVAALGSRLVTPEARAFGARAIGQLVLEAEGLVPANPAHATRNARVRACRAELVSIAFHLARSESEVHPTSILLLHRILTSSPTSPLYRAESSDATLRSVLRRVEAGIVPPR
jgi:hypothetical protein